MLFYVFLSFVLKQTQGLATLAIKSAHFGTYLRMDGWGPYAPSTGGGIVNCQPFIGIYELFRLGIIFFFLFGSLFVLHMVV